MSSVLRLPFPGTAKKLLLEHLSRLAEGTSPYNDFLEIGKGLGFALVRILKEVEKGSDKAQAAQAEALLDTFDDIRKGGGSSALVIEGLPIDENLGNTPVLPFAKAAQTIKDGYKGGFITEFVMLGVMSALGQTPGLMGGYPVSPLIPVPNALRLRDDMITDALRQNPKLVTVDKPGDLVEHTEASARPSPPDGLMLMGLRGGPGKSVTDIIPIETVLEGLSPRELKLLQGSYYHFHDEYREDNPVVVPILTIDSENRKRLRFIAHESRVEVAENLPAGVNREEVEGLLRKLIESVSERQQSRKGVEEIVVGPRDCVFINNRLCMHGRYQDEEARNAALEEESRVSGGKDPDPNTRWVMRTNLWRTEGEKEDMAVSWER